MSNQISAEASNQPVSLELVLKIVQEQAKEQAKESKEVRKDIADLSQQVSQMKEILNTVLEKDKLKRSSSSKSLNDEYKNERHIVISPKGPRDNSYVKRRATDGKIIYKPNGHEKSGSQ